MKRDTILILFALAGAIIGYGIGKINKTVGWDVVANTISGAFLFWQLGRAFLLKYYLVFIGPIVGLLISIGSDLLAGSEVVLEQKLMYTIMGLFAGWPIGKFRKPLIAGGMIGSIVGFIWGLNDSHWFGKVCLQPGVLNASLLAIQVALLGMSTARIIVEGVEVKFITKRNPPY